MATARTSTHTGGHAISSPPANRRGPRMALFTRKPAPCMNKKCTRPGIHRRRRPGFGQGESRRTNNDMALEPGSWNQASIEAEAAIRRGPRTTGRRERPDLPGTAFLRSRGQPQLTCFAYALVIVLAGETHMPRPWGHSPSILFFSRRPEFVLRFPMCPSNHRPPHPGAMLSFLPRSAVSRPSDRLAPTRLPFATKACWVASACSWAGFRSLFPRLWARC